MNKALMIVDVQEAFLNNHTKHIPEKVERLQHDYAKVIITQFQEPESGLFRKCHDFDDMDIHHFDLCFNLTKEATIFSKAGYGLTENQIWILHSMNLESIDICGLNTDACVMQIAMQLFDSGIRPIIKSDYCASMGGPRIHQCALQIMQRNLGKEQVETY